MYLVKPIAMNDSILASNIPEPDTGEVVYSGATTYALGDEVISTTTHVKYKSAVASNTGNDPDSDDGTNWIAVGFSNRYAMFSGTIRTDIPVIGTQSVETSNISVYITPGQVVTSVSGFNIDADSITVTMTVGVDTVYSKTVDMQDNSQVGDWFDYFFEPLVKKTRFVLNDLPPYASGVITVTMTSTGDVKCGELVLGRQIELGVALYGSSWQLLNFSRKERDDFGNFSVTQRRTADLFNYDVVIDKAQFSYVKNQLSAVNYIPCVFHGSDDVDDGTLVYGFYKDVQINFNTPTKLDTTIKIEGLV